MAKLFVTLAVLGIFGSVFVHGFDKKEAIAKFMEKADACKADVGANDADVEELIAKKPASTMEGKCLRSCIMKKYEVMDSNGKFVKDVAISHAEKFTDGAEDKMKIAHEMIDACGGIDVPADHCEAAETYGKCFKEEFLTRGLKDHFEM